MTLTAEQARRQDLTHRIQRMPQAATLEVVVLDPAATAGAGLAEQLGEYGISVGLFGDPIRAVAAAATSPTTLFILSCHFDPDQLQATAEAVHQQLGLPVVIACESWDTDIIGPAVMAGATPGLALPFSSLDVVDLIASAKQQPIRPATLVVGELVIDLEARDVCVAGDQHVDLSPTEFELLRQLAIHVDANLTRQQLLAWVWQGRPNGAITAAAKRLRKKLGEAGLPAAMHTIRGVGYRLNSAGCAPGQASRARTRAATSSTMADTSSGLRPTGSAISQSR